MKVPKRLEPLLREGLIDDVLRPLMSGKEAAVYLVRSGGELRCAKVYKEADQRNFKNRAVYQEGRRVRGSRRARAMEKRSKYGRQELEEAWQNAEVDALFALHRAGVRVPRPFMFTDGVLIMELISGDDGLPAPRLNDMRFSAAEARKHHRSLITDVVRMLCAGLIHGDLSEYNVLFDAAGPVIIDLPQAVNAAGNQAARRLFQRDVDNLAQYFGRFAPELAKTRFGREIWKLYERGELHPEYELTGLFEEETRRADVAAVLRDIDDAREEHQRRRSGSRVIVDIPTSPGRRRPEEPAAPAEPKEKRRRRRRGKPQGGGSGNPQQPQSSQAPPKAATKAQTQAPAQPPAAKRRRRRRRRRGGPKPADS